MANFNKIIKVLNIKSVQRKAQSRQRIRLQNTIECIVSIALLMECKLTADFYI